MKISILTRPGCHLCDDALTALNEYLDRRTGPGNVSRGLDTSMVDVVDIETDDELHRRYLERIPVILLDGQLVSELAFDPEEMDAALDRHGQGRG